MGENLVSSEHHTSFIYDVTTVVHEFFALNPLKPSVLLYVPPALT
jgi:hypothetical protein